MTASEDMRRATEKAFAGGDQTRLGSKLPVRERLEVLLDRDSWTEDGLLANSLAADFAADGVLTGTGTIEGRLVAVIAHDPTVKAGSWGAHTVEKQVRILETAERHLLPVFYLVDSAGGRLTEQLGFYPGRRGAARIFHLQVRLSGLVPQICCLLGPSAAGGAYMPAFCDWVGMVDGNASMALASPRIAEMTIGEKVTLEEMGGARMHTSVSGCGDELCSDDKSAFESAKRLFGYLPSSCAEPPQRANEWHEPQPVDWEQLIPENPRATYEMRDVIEALIDASSFFEVKERYAPELVIGFARIRGESVGIVANQPRVKAGAIFVDSADKATRFISLCDAFGIPLLFLCDTPGFMVGSAVERQGIIRHGAKMIAAMSSAEVPRYCVVVRKASGAGYYAMASPGFEPDATIALPSAQITAMGAEAAVNAVHANHIQQIEDADTRSAFVAERRAEYDADLGIARMASELLVDAVVQGHELRGDLVRRLAVARSIAPHRSKRRHLVSPV